MMIFFIRKLVLIGLFMLLPTSPGFAQQLDGLLKNAIGEVAEGKCPPKIMSPLLVSECEKFMPGFGRNVKDRGSITGVEFLGVQQSQLGPADAYKVRFSNGTTMFWLISVGSDDKIIVFWTKG